MTRRGQWGSGLAVVLCALAAVLLLAACGADERSDEFVGTWRQPDYQTVWSAPLVIAKTPDGYRGTMVFAEAQPEFALTRDGDKLRGTMELDVGTVRVEVVYLQDSGRLSFSNATEPGGPLAEPVQMVKVSDNTTIVTPSPF